MDAANPRGGVFPAALHRQAPALRRCVYTVLTGGYEVLNEQPAARDSALPFLCFTDRPGGSESWRMRPLAKMFPGDDVRSQRAYKLRPHLALPDFDQSLYIDNSVLLKLPPERLFERFDARAGMALPAHTFRASLRDEFTVAAEQRLDDPALILNQLAAYEAAFPALLRRPPLWSGMILRDHAHEAARAAGDVWFAHVCRYARRDQLSNLVAFELTGLRPQILQLDNHDSPFHSWPHIASRQGARRIWAGAVTPEDELRLELARMQSVIDELAKAREALLNSRSWRLTAPLRGLMRRLGRDRNE